MSEVLARGTAGWTQRGTGERAAVGVVVTHGFTGNTWATTPLGEHLVAQGYTVAVPLLPGHGTTHKELGRTRYDDWYGELDRTIDRLLEDCDRVVLVGHSMGATLSLDASVRRPGDVTAVAAIAAQILDRTELLARVAPLMQYVLPYVPRDLAGLPTDDIARPGASEGAYPMVPAKAAQSLLGELPRIRAALATLTQPLLVAYGPGDNTVPADNSRRLIESVASELVREVVCERSYHVVMLDYDADLLFASIAEFIADATGA